MSIVVFGLAAIAAVITAGAVVLQRNPFVSALALLGHLSALAALILLLQAEFVAAAQIIVYAGAVMVMFLFVIAYIGPRAELGHGRATTFQAAGAALAGALIVVNLIVAVYSTSFGEAAAAPEGYGSPATVGQAFLTDYLFAFEAVSLLLLVAAVAATVLGSGSRPTRVLRPGEEKHEQVGARERASAALVAQALEERRAATAGREVDA